MDFNLTKYQLLLLLILVVSGSINTISVKWMDMISAKGDDGISRPFVHPFVQADFMFVGESLCIVAFFIIFKRLASKKNGSENRSELTGGSRSFNRFMLLPPAVLDIFATSIMFYGLTLTNASSFQMLRGSTIVFTALFSFFVLKRKLSIRELIGVTLIIIALITVGLSDTAAHNDSKKEEGVGGTDGGGGGGGTDGGGEAPPEGGGEEGKADETRRRKRSNSTKFTMDVMGGRSDDSNIVLGDLLIIIAQFITACQMVYEEVYINNLDIPPLQMVGYEGIFGFIILTILMIPLNFIPNVSDLKHVNSNGKLEDTIDAFIKIGNRPLLIVPTITLIVSIALFNFSGVSLTKELNATTRMVLDSCRILAVWLVALAFGWQSFHYLQVM